MTPWLYLIVFVVLNVLVWAGMERINRRLRHITEQLDAAVSLLAQLNGQVAGSRREPDGGRRL